MDGLLSILTEPIAASAAILNLLLLNIGGVIVPPTALSRDMGLQRLCPVAEVGLLLELFLLHEVQACLHTEVRLLPQLLFLKEYIIRERVSSTHHSFFSYLWEQWEVVSRKGLLRRVATPVSNQLEVFIRVDLVALNRPSVILDHGVRD